jgi:sulfotransferase
VGPFIPVSTLPRSGSTLLCALLSQSPANHVSPTNDLSELIAGTRNQWTGCEGFRSQGIEKVAPRIRSTLKAMIAGFYRPEYAAGKVVFDKSRSWLGMLPLLEDILERRVQVVVTVRDLRDVVASLEKLFHTNPLTRPARSPQQQVNGMTVEQRCRQYLAPDAMTGIAIHRIKNAFETGYGDRLIIVPYTELVLNPKLTIARLHQDLGLPPFVCDPDHVEHPDPEQDMQVHGLPLHALRPEVDTLALERWRGVIPEETAAWIDTEFTGIQELARGGYRNIAGEQAAQRSNITPQRDVAGIVAAAVPHSQPAGAI